MRKVADTLTINYNDDSKQVIKPDLEQFDRRWNKLAEAVANGRKFTSQLS